VANGETALGGLTMERFPTWHVWKLLHIYPEREVHLLLRVLHVEPYTPFAMMHSAWIWVMINFFVSLGILQKLLSLHLSVGSILWIDSLLLSLLITLDSLRFALKIIASISKLREIGNYDLYALLPAGEFASVFNICRTHRFRLDSTIRGIKSLLIVLVVGMSCALSFLISLGNSGIFELLVIWILFAGLVRCIDYVQSFVAATLIALLASQHQNRSEVQIWTISGFLGLQIALYIVLFPLLINIPFFWQDNEFFPRRLDDTYLWWLIVLAPILFVLCRELINFVLWQAVKRRLEAS
jgi:hypothetical protein